MTKTLQEVAPGDPAGEGAGETRCHREAASCDRVLEGEALRVEQEARGRRAAVEDVAGDWHVGGGVARVRGLRRSSARACSIEITFAPLPPDASEVPDGGLSGVGLSASLMR